jgi:hypothetical protein
MYWSLSFRERRAKCGALARSKHAGIWILLITSSFALELYRVQIENPNLTLFVAFKPSAVYFSILLPSVLTVLVFLVYKFSSLFPRHQQTFMSFFPQRLLLLSICLSRRVGLISRILFMIQLALYLYLQSYTT